VIGGPFEGRFRRAAVLHDAACGEKKDTWQDVHRMFYDACLCARVGLGKAQTMYWAVYRFGPRWEYVTDTQIKDGKTITITRTIAQQPAPPDTSVVAKAERYFAKKQLTPKEIEECTVAQIEAQIADWDAAAAKK
jgi:hypothetical protein